MSAINAEDLSIHYGDKVVIRDFTYRFDKGCYAFVGPNGSGKSSLLRVLAGLEKNFTGNLILPFEGKLNEKRSYLPDTPKFYPFIRVHEFINMVCKIRSVDADKYLARFGDVFQVSSIQDQKMNSLSLGQTKRVFCLLTLLDECPIWILDEPSNGLDAPSREALSEAIQDHAKEGLVIMSEHNQAFLSSLPECRQIPLGA